MAHRDYKRPSTSRRGQTRKKAGGGLLKTLLLGLLGALAMAAAILWLVWPRAQDFKKTASVPAVQEPVKTPTTGKPAADSKPPASPGQDYTFYEILPGNQPAKPLPPQQVATQWWLQVAALRNASDADTLRAKLSLLNFNVVVQPTPAGEPLLYRVRVGPYGDEATALSAQKQLAENKIESRALKEAVSH